ncbi:HNH endonuclease [Prescottella equi]|uniref:HNH endonuclease n=1 Tax=Rhodococcus hoagii TaxID=43767 RepID=UPI001F9ED0F5|nr:hypothetical protein [Prescottella equi]
MSTLYLDTLRRVAGHLENPPWSESELVTIAALDHHVTASIGDQLVIRSDHALNDAFWSLLALCDPLQFPGCDPEFALIYSEVHRSIGDRFGILPDEIPEYARPIADFLANYRVATLSANSRKSTRSVRADLIDIGPWCWYCGSRFNAQVIDAFISGSTQKPDPPLFVDNVSRRGVADRDSAIEIDHIQPLSLGGSDSILNLRLSCGWCNRYKSAITTLYDVPSRPAPGISPTRGRFTAPHPYWIIRYMGTRRRCEHKKGCSSSLDSEQLFAAPKHLSGALVPGNIGVFCSIHDPISEHRWVPNPRHTSS